jgi:L-fuconate dehydratase
MARIIDVEVRDIRFPTSLALDGSDAMNPDPDYSAAYVTLRTDGPEALTGNGFTFTIGRGNELCVLACKSMAPMLIGLELDDLRADLSLVWNALVGDSQFRWVGPEKGVIHLATAALVNAVWDLLAKAEGKPIWRFLSDLTAAEIVSIVDFRYISDALTPSEAMDLISEARSTNTLRERDLAKDGLLAYTTSAGWLGYEDDKVRRLCREAVDDGWGHFKVKVGGDIVEDLRRCRLVREEIGWDRALMLDANQKWGISESIENMRQLAEVSPLWIEEPTSPDDILGHARILKAIAPVGVATGEMVHNRIMFKQMLQANALTYLQIDSCRLGGLNEVVAVLLLAAKFDVPVVPHAGGVGLCEYVQHIAAFDYLTIARDPSKILVEYVDHLHEHFVDPVRIENAHYMLPTAPGYSASIRIESLEDYTFPTGRIWMSRS